MEVVSGERSLVPFAARATDSLAAFLGDSDVRVVSGGAGARRAQLAFSGAVSVASGQTQLRLTLEDKRSGTTLWSRDFAESDARGDALIDEAKGAAIEVTNLVRPLYGPSGPLVDSETLLHALRGGEDAVLPTTDAANDAVHEYELALARTPDSAILQAAHANVLVLAAQGAPAPVRGDMLRRAKGEAERVIREHPRSSGVAYLALLGISRTRAPRDWVGEQKQLDVALKAAPDEPFLANYACQVLGEVGRFTDALYYCRRALAMRPHTGLILVNYAYALDSTGDLTHQATAMLDETARLYPDLAGVRIYRFAREGFVGSPDKALSLLDDPATVPPITPAQVRALELLQKARKSRSTHDGDAAMAAMRDADAHLPIDDFRVLFPMALGRMDEAYAGPDINVFQDEMDFLMSVVGEPLRGDRRFWPLAARLGLVRYWTTTGRWPDFCSDPSYPLDCKAEARRVAAVPVLPPAAGGL
jgi:hypothetical protein